MNLENFLSEVSVHKIWNSQKGHGSALCLDMGSKNLKKGPKGIEYVEGDICLWVYCCDWKIKLENKTLCHSESMDEQIDEKLKLFVGTFLININKKSLTQIEIGFKNGLAIILDNDSGDYEEDDDFFTLYLKGSNLSYNQKNGFTIEESE